MEKPSLLEFRVKENKAGDEVGRIVVGVRKGNPKFSLLDDFSAFSIAQDGTLYTKAALDREIRSSYFITVVAQIGRAERYYQVSKKSHNYFRHGHDYLNSSLTN